MRRTDVLLFGTIFTILFFLLISVIFVIKPFLVIINSGWVTVSWMFFLMVIIFPVRFFPKTKWAKWWDGKPFSKKVTD